MKNIISKWQMACFQTVLSPRNLSNSRILGNNVPMVMDICFHGIQKIPCKFCTIHIKKNHFLQAPLSCSTPRKRIGAVYNSFIVPIPVIHYIKTWRCSCCKRVFPLICWYNGPATACEAAQARGISLTQKLPESQRRDNALSCIQITSYPNV